MTYRSYRLNDARILPPGSISRSCILKYVRDSKHGMSRSRSYRSEHAAAGAFGRCKSIEVVSTYARAQPITSWEESEKRRRTFNVWGPYWRTTSKNEQLPRKHHQTLEGCPAPPSNTHGIFCWPYDWRALSFWKFEWWHYYYYYFPRKLLENVVNVSESILLPSHPQWRMDPRLNAPKK